MFSKFRLSLLFDVISTVGSRHGLGGAEELAVEGESACSCGG